MTVLSILWSITWGSWLTALAIILIRLLFHRVLSGKAKYYLWLLLALRLMLPVLPQSALSIQNYLPIASQTAHIPAAAASAPGDTAPLPSMSIPAAAMPEQNDVSSAGPTSAVSAETASAFSPSQILLLVYLLGVLAAGVTYLILYVLTARHLHRLPLCTDPETLRVWLRLRRQLHSRSEIRLCRGESAMSGGLFRPTIVLPAEITKEAAAPILVHEAMHIGSHDLILHFLYRLLICLNWFNPVVWLCFRQAFRDSEGACDQRVLETGLVDRTDYAQALYQESLLSSPQDVYIRSAFGSGRTIRRRISVICHFAGKRPWMAPLALALGVLVSACTMTSRSASDDSAQVSAPSTSDLRTTEESMSSLNDASLAEPEGTPYVPLAFDGENACINGLFWGITPEAIMHSMGFSEDQFSLTNRGKNYNASVEDPFAEHPEVRKIVYNFQLTDLELTKGLNQVEIFYEDGYYDLDSLLRVCTDILGQPDTQEYSWTRFPDSAVTLSDVNNLKLTIRCFAFNTINVSDFDIDGYLESLMPPNGHYGWTLQQHVDAGLLNPSNGTLSTAEDGSQTFRTVISLGGQDVQAVYYFVEPLLSRGTGAFVLTEIHVQPPENIPFSQWLDAFSGSFTDKLYERSQWDYVTPITVGNFLTDDQKDAVNEAALPSTGAGASTEGWPLICNWYDSSAQPGIWKFNGTGYALYLSAIGALG